MKYRKKNICDKFINLMSLCKICNIYDNEEILWHRWRILSIAAFMISTIMTAIVIIYGFPTPMGCVPKQCSQEILLERNVEFKWKVQKDEMHTSKSETFPKKNTICSIKPTDETSKEIRKFDEMIVTANREITSKFYLLRER